VRFSGVSQETVDGVKARVEANDGPPPGVNSTGMKLLFDAEQGTSVFIGFFETEEDMREADRILDGMNAPDTPGERVSVDRCEVVIEREVD
jgi:hypothetical protein